MTSVSLALNADDTAYELSVADHLSSHFRKTGFFQLYWCVRDAPPFQDISGFHTPMAAGTGSVPW